MDKVTTKKRVFWGSGTIVALLVLLGTVGDQVCGEGNIRCMVKITNIIQMLYPFFPLFFLSLITFWMREEIFRVWLRFACWWIPLTIILVAISPSTSADFQIIDREFVAMVFTLLFTLVSLILIAYKSLALRKKG